MENYCQEHPLLLRLLLLFTLHFLLLWQQSQLALPLCATAELDAIAKEDTHVSRLGLLVLTAAILNTTVLMLYSHTQKPPVK